MHKKSLATRIVALSAAVFSTIFFSACSSKKENRIVIWTSSSEFASYVELFNESHKNKAVIVYKENPVLALGNSKNEQRADLVVGNWLRNEKTRHNFRTVDFLFDRNYIQHNSFYPELLKSGTITTRQYLLPVSFNLPAIIFSVDNKKYVPNDYTISLEDLKNIGSEFNQKDKKNHYTRIGFAPQSSTNFMYTATKMKGATFQEGKKSQFIWNENNLNSALAYLVNWITEVNSDPQTESDFVYKYLSVTDDKRVTGGKTLFAYTTSDKLFRLTSEQLAKLDFCWLENQGFIPLEDEMLMFGIPRRCKNLNGATEFISWFYKVETQKEILERKMETKLEINRFGIAGGFSAIKDVNERILPIYYTRLLSNIPQQGSLKVMEKKPSRWEQIKTKVVIPYIEEKVFSSPDKKIATMQERLDSFNKQNFNIE